MANNLSRRAELAADYALISIHDFNGLGLGNCAESAFEPVDMALFSKGPVKTVFVSGADSAIECILPDGARAYATHYGLAASTFLPARNDAVSVSGIENLLLVANRVGERRIVAAISFDTMLYDYLPAEIRDTAMARIALSDGRTVAEFGTDIAKVAISDESPRSFSARSDRYPLSVSIAIPSFALDAWGADGAARSAAYGGLVGFLLASIAGALMTQPRTMRDDLRDAITAGQILPHFQPVFRLSDNGLCGCEALARWIRPDGSKIAPDRFIALAEAEGLIKDITLQVVKASAVELSGICHAIPDFKLSINMPPELLLDSEFLSQIDAIFAEAGIPLNNIVLEITERQPIADSKAVRKAILDKRKAGYRFALDDTGVGHNGLANVQGVPVDIIKIDKCFVDMIEHSAESVGIVRMLVALAAELGKSTVAEGVERREQAQILHELGVDEGQGYMISPALPASEFTAVARAWIDSCRQWEQRRQALAPVRSESSPTLRAA